MFTPLSLYIGLRYTRAKRRNQFISFNTIISIVGIVLGVAVLITVLSVMNGFDQHIKQRIFGMANHITIARYGKPIEDWTQLAHKVSQDKAIVASAPFVIGQGMLTHLGLIHAAIISGIDPKYEQHISILAQKMQQGSLAKLVAGKFGMIVGDQLAQQLGLTLGDKVVLLTPKASVSLLGIQPNYKRFTIVGIFKIGNGFGFDSQYAYINLHDAQALYQLGHGISGIRLRVKDLFAAPIIGAHIQNLIGPDYIVSNWTQQYGALVKAIRLEKTMMFLMLMLIIAVAAFNLISSMVMMVTEKQADIAILKTIGVTPGMIMRIFIIQGCVIGLFGTLIGLIGGVALALNITHLFNWVEQVFHVQLLAANVYYVNFLPSQLQWSDVWHVCILAFFLCVLATIYPAWRAGRTQAAEALRYE